MDAPKRTILTPELIAHVRKLEGIFLPHTFAQREMKRQSDNPGKPLTADNVGRFVHYTSAEAALKIIATKRLWMRSTTCMIDYKEVDHGHDLLVEYFQKDGKREEFCNICNSIVPGVAKEVVETFDKFWNDIRVKTYITSVSEHDTSEDNLGRLSMWRAFGSHPRVALVFDVPWHTPATLALGITFSPVSYLNGTVVHEMLERVVGNIAREKDFLAALPVGEFRAMLFQVLLSGVSCLKHEGFKEEREWRGVYTTAFGANSALLETGVECIGGVPQILHKIPIDGSVSPDLGDLDIAKTLSRVIVGPTQFGWVMYEAFVAALEAVGIKDAGAKVWTSNLPIRG
jgi:hypothetical protein